MLNTATARGTETNGVTVSASDSATATAAQRAALQVVKTLVSGSPYRAPGDVLTYQLIATNTGSVTLTNVTLSDPKLGALTCAQPVTLAARPGADLHGHLPVTQADVDAGSVRNTATATGQDPNGTTLRGADSASATAIQNAALQVRKTIVSGSPYAAPGQVISYQLLATNAGNVTLTNVTLSDPQLGTLSCLQPVTLLPGETLTCTGSYAVTQADVDAGFVLNTPPPAAPKPTASPCATRQRDGDRRAARRLDRPQDARQRQSLRRAGPGAQLPNRRHQHRQRDADQRDAQRSEIGRVDLPATRDLAARPGVDLHGHLHRDAGRRGRRVVVNTATATGRQPDGVTLSGTDRVTATAAQAAALQLIKTITSGDQFTAVGDRIDYQLVATNTGNVTLTNVTITDPKIGALTCPQPVTLRPGQALTCTGSYTRDGGRRARRPGAQHRDGHRLGPAGRDAHQPGRPDRPRGGAPVVQARRERQSVCRAGRRGAIPVDRDQRRVGDADGRADQRSATRRVELRATRDAATRRDADLHRQLHRDAGRSGRGLRAQHRLRHERGPRRLAPGRHQRRHRHRGAGPGVATAQDDHQRQSLHGAGPGPALPIARDQHRQRHAHERHDQRSEAGPADLRATRHAPARPGADLHRQLTP